MRSSVGRLSALIAGVVALGVLPMAGASDAAAVVADEPLGSTPAAAAGSCWELKQKRPTARNGVYWLLTPLMTEPQQFFCDMTTDGGGWVLVGKGRDGWTDDYSGKGSPDELLSPATSPMSAKTSQLPSDTIDELLNGTRVDQLQDGVRLRRARNKAGSRWQEVRFRFARHGGWTWTFGAGFPLTGFSFGKASGTGGESASFGLNRGFRRVVNTTGRNKRYRLGFSYGPKVKGSSKASTHLYSAVNGAGGAQPYTLVYLRPRVASDDAGFAPLGDAGTTAISEPQVIRSTALASPWGVSGTAGDASLEGSVEVQAFTEAGGRMYLGGNFRYVQRDAAGTDRVEQPFLAAFEVSTGEWVPSFRPKLNEQVRALATLPSGEILAAGDFTRANGRPTTPIVALDPDTGASSTTWALEASRTGGNSTVRVRALDVAGSHVLIGGRFTHLTGGTTGRAVAMRNLGRVSAVDATPTTGWDPNLNGSVIDVDVSDDLSRVYASGHFEKAGGLPAFKAAVVSNGETAELLSASWSPDWSNKNENYQQAIEEIAGKIWVGGAQHSLFQFSRETFERLAGNILAPSGDVQAIESDRGVVYAGCHCNGFNYTGAYRWPKVPSTWQRADAISWFGAWDASSGQVVPQFVPTLTMRLGQGIWAIEADSAGTVWAGGDIATVRTNAQMARWSGGFARFPLADATPPPTPGNLAVIAEDASSVTLSWDRVSDANGGVRYQILRDDRPIAMTTDNVTMLTVPKGGLDRFFVRAVDRFGNVSASTAVLELGAHAGDGVL